MLGSNEVNYGKRADENRQIQLNIKKKALRYAQYRQSARRNYSLVRFACSL